MPAANNLSRFPKPLLEELRAGRVLPIIGAGFSRNATVASGRTVPLWDDLGRVVAADIPGHAYMGAVDALSAFEHEFGRRELVKRITQALLIGEAQPGPAHEAFARLGFTRVVTTNFDDLLERAYAQVGRICEVVIAEDQLVLPNAPGGTTLLKLHGDVRHPGRIVATESDFDSFIGRYPLFATHLASLLIERVPLLIGYSLEDPDLRQIFALLRDRLGAALPVAYTLLVGADQSTNSRYDRRGIKVINLAGNSENYGGVLAAALRELNDYWTNNALGNADFKDEAPLEQVTIAAPRADSRLCYFTMPRHLLPFYRDEIFPLAEQALLVPVSGFDVDVESGNRLAATGALIRRSRVAVIDMTENTGSVEFTAAVELLGAENVLVISASVRNRLTDMMPRLTVILRTQALKDEPGVDFFSEVQHWLEGHRATSATIGNEAAGLIEQGQWRPALIAAISDLELVLRQALPIPRLSPRAAGQGRPFTLRQALAAPELMLDDALRSRLMQSVALRNGALHEGARVTPAQARAAVADVETTKSLLLE
jgi:hypothetical protein